MKRSFSKVVLVLSLFVVAALFGTGAASPAARTPQQQSERQPILQHEVGVTLKLIQVFVTGKDGKPVSDLTAQDFEISDNGKKVPVYHLEKHFAEAGEATAAPAPAGPLLSRKFFLLFDFAFVVPKGVVKAKETALQVLGNLLRPGDEVALLSYTPIRGLTVHEYLTTDHQKVLQLVDGFGIRNSIGRAERLTDYLYQTYVADGTFSTPSRGQALPEDDLLSQREAARQPDGGTQLTYVDQARQFIRTLDNLAKVLSYIPGNKNIILFSGGIARQVLFGKTGGAVLGEWTTPEQLASQMKSYDSARANRNLQDDFNKVLKECKAANCPVYAVDVSRVRGDVDVANPEGMGESLREFDGADSLKQLAGQTGGEYYGNTMEAGPVVSSIKEATSDFYVLGFQVNEAWDGKYHKVKVNVLRKGCDVQSQAGYFNPKPYLEYSNFEKLLQLTDLALNENPQSQIPLPIDLCALPVMVKGFSVLTAFARIPKTLAAEVAGPRTGAILLVFDAQGSLVILKDFRFAAPAEKADSLYPVFVLPLAAGPYSCRMVVYNQETGLGARGTAPLVVPPSAPTAVWLDPPLLLQADRGAREIPVSPALTLSSLYAYDRAAYAPLSGEWPAGPGKIYAALRCAAGGDQSELSCSVALRDVASQTQTSLPFTIVGRGQDGPEKHVLLEFDAGALKPGRYELAFEVRRAGVETPASATAAFSVI